MWCQQGSVPRPVTLDALELQELLYGQHSKTVIKPLPLCGQGIKTGTTHCINKAVGHAAHRWMIQSVQMDSFLQYPKWQPPCCYLYGSTLFCVHISSRKHLPNASTDVLAACAMPSAGSVGKSVIIQILILLSAPKSSSWISTLLCKISNQLDRSESNLLYLPFRPVR